ncbi:MAG: hypothetical protein KAW02_01905 [candidate division Zixibacteria bacterium]|nr:hypothetical protein [candidate division Zixibacteria bacterium]
MNWTKYHSESEKLASQAEAALKDGKLEEAERLYQLAADAEARALSVLDQTKKRTFGITAVSAASLYFKGKDFGNAEQTAYKYLATNKLPSFAAEQLQSILQSIWNEKIFQRAGIEFVKGAVLVSVSGGLVVPGGAPLDLIHRKVDEVKNIFYRIIEMLLNCPFRRRGLPSSEIQDQFRPWLFQTDRGSYRFAVRVQKPSQTSLLPDRTPEIEDVTQKFFEVVEASAQDTHEKLEEIVPNSEYRESFLKITRNLAPTGKSFERLEIKSATDIEAAPIVFLPESREAINKTLRASKKKTEEESELKEEQLSGILRNLSLDKDWIEIHTPEKDHRTIRISQTGDMIDDIVGPMVNQRVLVDVFVKPDGTYLFRDIQSEE